MFRARGFSDADETNARCRKEESWEVELESSNVLREGNHGGVAMCHEELRVAHRGMKPGKYHIRVGWTHKIVRFRLLLRFRFRI